MVIRVRGIEIDNKARSIKHQNHLLRGISNMRWRYFMCLLLGGGMTAEEMLEMLYGDREDGGPSTQEDH